MNRQTGKRHAGKRDTQIKLVLTLIAYRERAFILLKISNHQFQYRLNILKFRWST